MKLQSGLRTEESRRKWDKIFGNQEEEVSYSQQPVEEHLTDEEIREALDLSMKAAEKMTEPFDVFLHKFYLKVQDKPRQATISVFDSDENTTDNLTIGGSNE